MSRALVAAIVIAYAARTPAQAQFAPERAPVPGAWGPNGRVTASAVVDHTLFLTGEFDYIGPPTGRFGTIDLNDGSAIVASPEVTDQGIGATSDGAGGWFVLSRALPSSGPAPAPLVHLLADGRRDPAFSPPHFDGGPAIAVAMAGGRLYVGGDFLTVNGAAHRALAALDPASGSVLPWDPQLTSSGLVPNVNLLSVDGDRLYAAGRFNLVGGQARLGLAVFHTATGQLENVTFARTIGQDVYTLSAAGGRLYAGGGCRAANGAIVPMCAYANDGSPLDGWSAHQPQFGARLYATPTRVYIADNVFPVPGQIEYRVLGFDPVSGAPDGWHTPPLAMLNIYGVVFAMVETGGQVYVGGEFVEVGGVPRARLASFDAASAALSGWRPAAGHTVGVLATDGTRLAVTGSFSSIGGRSARTIAALDLHTGGPAPLALPSFSSGVRAIAASGSLVVAAAGAELVAFSGTTGEERARVDIDTPGQPPGTINALAIAEPRLYIGGRFVSVLGRPRQHLAAIDLATGQPTDWNPQPNNDVNRLWVSSGAVYAQGSFTAVPGYGRSGVAAWDVVTGALETFAPPNLGYVFDAAFFRERVLLAGGFGQAPDANGTAWVDRVTGEPLNLGRAVPFLAKGVGRSGDTLVVGGNATPGFRPAGIAAINAATGATLDWHPSIEGVGASVEHVQATPQYVVLTGWFSSVAGTPAHNLAIFRAARASTPVRMTAAVIGATATIAWQTGTGPTPTSYSVEVGTSAGASNVGTFDVGMLTRVAGSLPPGTFHARVRAIGLNGPGAAGSEVILTVPPMPAPPQAPGPLSVSIADGVVTLNWAAAAGNAATHLIEAGTASGLADVGALPTGSLDTTFATPAPPGTYYVRVRAVNAFGTGPASNEALVVVP